MDDLVGTPVVHDIGSSYTKELLDDSIFVGERPTVITFRAATPDARVHVAVESAIVDTLLLVVLAVAVLASAAACVVPKRRGGDVDVRNGPTTD